MAILPQPQPGVTTPPRSTPTVQIALTDAERVAMRDRALWSQSGMLFAAVERIIAARMAQAWDEARRARPQYLGPNDGHYEGCMGWEDCDCASYPNPYRGERTEGGGTR